MAAGVFLALEEYGLYIHQFELFFALSLNIWNDSFDWKQIWIMQFHQV